MGVEPAEQDRPLIVLYSVMLFFVLSLVCCITQQVCEQKEMQWVGKNFRESSVHFFWFCLKAFWYFKHLVFHCVMTSSSFHIFKLIVM